MFQFFKPKAEPAPEGAVEFVAEVEVDRPAADVYALIDWADPRNAKRELGHSVETLRDPDLFRLVMTNMPDLRFDMRLIEAVPGRSYAFASEIVPKVGRLESSEEYYSIEPIGDQRCTLRLTMIATFQTGMTMDEFAEEIGMMTFACHRGVAKLKVHAEHGAEAVKQFDGLPEDD